MDMNDLFAAGGGHSGRTRRTKRGGINRLTPQLGVLAKAGSAEQIGRKFNKGSGRCHGHLLETPTIVQGPRSINTAQGGHPVKLNRIGRKWGVARGE